MKYKSEQTFTTNGERYSVDKLIEMSANEESIRYKVSDLKHMIEDECWSDEIHDKEMNLPNFSPKQVLEQIEEKGVKNVEDKYSHHYNKILKANLNYPLILFRNNEGELQLADGMHRLTKAFLENKKTIKAIIFTYEEMQQARVKSKTEKKETKQEPKSVMQEFKEFIVRGNIIEIMIGLTVGTAFTKLVNSLVNNLIMPLIGLLMSDESFMDLFIALDGKHYENLEAAEEASAPILKYGQLFTDFLDFLIIALTIFAIIKVITVINRRREEEERKKK